MPNLEISDFVTTPESEGGNQEVEDAVVSRDIFRVLQRFIKLKFGFVDQGSVIMRLQSNEIELAKEINYLDNKKMNKVWNKRSSSPIDLNL